MRNRKPSYLNDPWKLEGKRAYVSPDVDDGHLEQVAAFADTMHDGSLETTITPVTGLPDQDYPGGRIEANILFRYVPREHGYCAGLGAFGKKYFIAKVRQVEAQWHKLEVLRAEGDGSSLRFDRAYRLRVSFVGSRITLVPPDMRPFAVDDTTYTSGQWGLRTFKTKAKFQQLVASTAPRCFVAMPFDPTLNETHKAIERAVNRCGLTCVRGDQMRTPSSVIEDIKAEISRADLVIVDFTGQNANVYYEAGFADALQKPRISLAQRKADLSFNVQHLRTIMYSVAEYERLSRTLREMIKATRETHPVRNPERHPSRRPGSGRSR